MRERMRREQGGKERQGGGATEKKRACAHSDRALREKYLSDEDARPTRHRKHVDKGTRVPLLELRRRLGPGVRRVPGLAPVWALSLIPSCLLECVGGSIYTRVRHAAKSFPEPKSRWAFRILFRHSYTAAGSKGKEQRGKRLLLASTPLRIRLHQYRSTCSRSSNVSVLRSRCMPHSSE